MAGDDGDARPLPPADPAGGKLSPRARRADRADHREHREHQQHHRQAQLTPGPVRGGIIDFRMSSTLGFATPCQSGASRP
jgi:hypothetical protein